MENKFKVGDIVYTLNGSIPMLVHRIMSESNVSVEYENKKTLKCYACYPITALSHTPNSVKNALQSNVPIEQITEKITEILDFIYFTAGAEAFGGIETMHVKSMLKELVVRVTEEFYSNQNGFINGVKEKLKDYFNDNEC